MEISSYLVCGLLRLQYRIRMSDKLFSFNFLFQGVKLGQVDFLYIGIRPSLR